MGFKDGVIEGVVVLDLGFFSDDRGWLAELFRKDSLASDVYPEMAYISMTRPGVARGPHEHREQTDYFVFFTSEFKVFLWDSRPDSVTYENRMVITAGRDKPSLVIVPPGVVHAYKNTGVDEGITINLPNRLYAGWGKKGPVDEVRYEDDPDTPYRVEG